MTDARRTAETLACWTGPVSAEPLKGGITNTNFLVTTETGERFVVRIGDDIPEHGVMRFNELTAARAAFEAGLSPEVVHAEPGAFVMRFVEGRTLSEEDVRAPGMIDRIVPLLRRCHRDLPQLMEGPLLAFWPFQVVRGYGRLIVREGGRLAAQVPTFLDLAQELEEAVGPVTVVFGHNDLLAANLIDAGDRLWLLDWDYAGFNSPLFDLANLSSNNGLSPEQEERLLTLYFGRSPDAATRRGFHAMKCASLLREAMWSMVSELRSSLDFDYIAYTTDYLGRLERAHTAFTSMEKA